MRRDDSHKTGRNKTEKPGIERRNLLKGLGIGVAGAAAATLANTAGPTEAAPVSRQYELKARYQDNAHVERFYALNRL